MRENIALTGQIDPEHCPRQHLVTVPSITICSSFGIAPKYIRECCTAQQVDDVELLDIFE
jgi:hypothetical protein